MVVAQNIIQWGGGTGTGAASQPMALKMALQIRAASVLKLRVAIYRLSLYHLLYGHRCVNSDCAWESLKLHYCFVSFSGPVILRGPFHSFTSFPYIFFVYNWFRLL
jgi:hypothetical protein